MHQLVVDSISRADLDLRRSLFSNVVLSGGTTLCKGSFFFFPSLPFTHSVRLADSLMGSVDRFRRPSAERGEEDRAEGHQDQDLRPAGTKGTSFSLQALAPDETAMLTPSFHFSTPPGSEDRFWPTSRRSRKFVDSSLLFSSRLASRPDLSFFLRSQMWVSAEEYQEDPDIIHKKNF